MNTMNEDREDDPLMDLWITNWERQCVDVVESEPDYEGQLQSERDLINQKVWFSFQNTATSIAQLYKDRLQGVSLWIPFQTAAGTVTTLFKESTDGMRRTSELGIQCGYQRRNKEILNWARKKRHHIRREDLLAYLAGKPPPPRPHHHRSNPRPRIMLSERHGSPNSLQMMDAHHHDLHHHHISSENISSDDNLHTFREALALPNSPTNISRRQRSSELSAFIAGEMARHCKRPAPPSSPHDVNMDSPTHKRSRLM
ncbi:HUWE1-associated protein modifying stress responses [Anabrus simplex]|uniref:HUWE1-associated protein modifying stress responses n=1 Tax=Anabrus simplex TaxID=316456 RepID=UPI0035A2DC10